LAEALIEKVRHVKLEDLAARDAEGNLAALGELIRELRGSLYDISESLSDRHFRHLIMSRMTPSR
jgi:hypothetical protein